MPRLLRLHADRVGALLLFVLWEAGPLQEGFPRPASQWVLSAVCGAFLTLPFAVRRRRPLSTMALVVAAGAVLGLAGDRDLPIGMVVAAPWLGWTLGTALRGSRSVAAVAVAVIVVGVSGARHNDAGPIGLALTPLIFVGLPWAVGQLVVRLRAERGALEDLTVRLEQEQQEVARASVIEERARIARELHDIVAHSISVMVVQAGAAEQVVDPDSAARPPLAAIRTTGQEALVEMRRLLGILRSDDEAPLTLAPQPGLDHLEGLVDAARRSGLDVTVDVRGDRVPLPAGVDVAAYRLVQESFSNVRKHARARTAAVVVAYEPSCLTIDVADDGVGGSGRDRGGHGIVGMRERVALYGGRLECGPRADGGWRVRASLPLASAR